MIKQAIFAIIIFFAAIIAAPTTCHEVPIVFEEIPSPQADEGFVVRGQTTFSVDTEGKVQYTIKIAIDPDYKDDWEAIAMHEIGHAYHPDWTEEQCDKQACDAGFYIHDATY